MKTAPLTAPPFTHRILDGRTGVAFAPGVWHASATVFDGIGQFAVIWPRRDSEDDTQFHALSHPMLIEE